MQIKYCKKCNRLFNDCTGRNFCQNCSDELQDILKEIKTYIKENNTVTIAEVSKKFSVPTKQIIEWINQEEIELTKDSCIKIYCRNCNEQILSGQLCNKCKNKVLKEINSAYTVSTESSIKNKDKNRMRFLNKLD